MWWCSTEPEGIGNYPGVQTVMEMMRLESAEVGQDANLMECAQDRSSTDVLRRRGQRQLSYFHRGELYIEIEVG